MNTNIKTAENSPQVYARIGGALYLLIIVAGVFGELFVRGKIIVSGDAAATALNMMDHQLLWRLGIAGDLMMHVFDIPVMWVMYVLLRPVNKNLALLVVLFNLIQTAVLAANKLNLMWPLIQLSDVRYLQITDPAQVYAQAYQFLKMHDIGFGVGLIFFGFVCLVEGYLIMKSGYLPKVIGMLMQVAGLCYLANSFTMLIAPEIARGLFPFILLPPFIAELSLSLWLVIKGVDIKKWEEKAYSQQA